MNAQRLLLIALGATLAMLVGGWFLKAGCIGPTYNQAGVSTAFGQRMHRDLCYSDIQFLWPFRGIAEHVFPYVHGRIDGTDLQGGALEYPVLTGLFIWLTALPAGTDGQFLAISAACLVPFALLTTALLVRLTGRRALIWAAAPALLFYAFLNWDLLAVAAVVAGVWAWWRGRPAGAAALFALGAAAKLYPAMFVAPLAAQRLAERDARGFGRVIAAGVGTFALVNLPFLLVNPGGWWATYAFQGRRASDVTTNSIWYWGVPQLSTDDLNLLTPTLIGLAWLVALGVGWWRSADAPYPWIQVGAAMLCAFLVLNKVHSPQYILWLLPFFALIRVRWGWWVAYWALDALLFVGLDEWYGTGSDLARQATIIGVWGRAVMLALLYVAFLAAPLGVKAYSSSGSGASSSTPPAGSSVPSARTTSRHGWRMSRTTKAP